MTVDVLLAEHHRSIRGLIRQRAGRAVLRRIGVEDLHQEVVVEALTYSANFVYLGDAMFLRWIATIARRVMARVVQRPGIDFIKRIRNAESCGSGVPADSLIFQQAGPSSIVNRLDQKAALSEAIQTLPAHYRQALTLYSLLQWPISAVAAQLQRTERATYCLVARATRCLREILDQRNGLSDA